MDIAKFNEEHQKMIDSLGGYTAAYMRLLKQKVFWALSQRAKQGVESVSMVSGAQILYLRYSVDLYTETGISKLKVPPFSCFELKDRLVSDSVFRISKFAETHRKRYPGARVYLLYQDRGMLTEQVEREAKRQKLIEICQIDEFIAWAEKAAKINDQIEQFESDWKTERETVIDIACNAFRENHCSFFLGAGVSMSAGGPSWETLLRRLTRRYSKIGKKADFDRVYEACSKSPIILGRYVVSSKQSHTDISEYLRRYVLYRDINPNESELIKVICDAVEGTAAGGRAIAGGAVDSIITYNYDDLVETALETRGIEVARIYLKSRNHRGEIPVYHVHGLIPQKKQGIESTPILSERDYHEMYREAFNWSNVEQIHALDRNTCFFIGLSMTDPNLRRLLDFSRSGSDNDSRHFAFLKREPMFKSDQVEKNKRHYRTIEFQLLDLGVQVIWYENYEEVPVILRRIISPR